MNQSILLQMMSEEKKCCICFKFFDDPRWMPCKHIYCFKCIPRLHRHDLSTKDQIILQCRICSIRHSFQDWSAVKYYATLHCVPYLTALRFDRTPISPNRSLCSICFNDVNGGDSKADHLEYCMHCNKMICHECLIDHRMELKKNILHSINRYRLFRRRNEQNVQQVASKLDNLNVHIDFCASEFMEQIDTYYYSILAQIDEQQLLEESNSSSGYESFGEQGLPHSNDDITLQSNLSLTAPSIVPIQLLGELISSQSKLPTSLVNSPTAQILWTMTLSFDPSYLVYEPCSSKLFLCSQQGYISVYKYTTTSLSLIDSFVLPSIENSQLVNMKSLTASEYSLIIIFNSSIESLLHLYSHHGDLLHALSFFNEYISQIRFDNHQLWCLELISSSLFYFSIQSNLLIGDKKAFISFKEQSFNPFRFAFNQTLVAIIDRASTGILLLYDRQTTTYLRQIKCPLIDYEPYDIELTNQLFIYRFPHLVLLTKIDDESRFLERIAANKNLSITIGKSDDEILISTSTADQHTFLVQCFIK